MMTRRLMGLNEVNRGSLGCTHLDDHKKQNITPPTPPTTSAWPCKNDIYIKYLLFSLQKMHGSRASSLFFSP